MEKRDRIFQRISSRLKTVLQKSFNSFGPIVEIFMNAFLKIKGLIFLQTLTFTYPTSYFSEQEPSLYYKRAYGHNLFVSINTCLEENLAHIFSYKIFSPFPSFLSAARTHAFSKKADNTCEYIRIYFFLPVIKFLRNPFKKDDNLHSQINKHAEWKGTTTLDTVIRGCNILMCREYHVCSQQRALCRSTKRVSTLSSFVPFLLPWQKHINKSACTYMSTFNKKHISSWIKTDFVTHLFMDGHT